MYKTGICWHFEQQIHLTQIDFKCPVYLHIQTRSTIYTCCGGQNEVRKWTHKRRRFDHWQTPGYVFDL